MQGWARAALGLGLALIAAASTARAADPTAQELHFLYEVNRARHDPPAWAAQYGLGSVIGGDGQPVTLAGVARRPPLAWNATLTDSARFKAQEMATNNYFGHQSVVLPNSYWPNELVRNVFGYPLAPEVPDPAGGGFSYTLDDDGNQIESLAAGYGPGLQDYTKSINALKGLIIDAGISGLGHRKHLLAMTDFNTVFVEAAAGYGVNVAAAYRNYWAFHTGVPVTKQMYLTGVAFSDNNLNTRFDPGEGLAGVTVDAGATSVVTGATGGYSLLLPFGTYEITCSGGPFAGTAATRIAVIGFNRQIDCLSGEPNAWVDFVELPEPDALALGVAAAAALAAARRRREMRSNP